jgi:hypothetical protein
LLGTTEVARAGYRGQISDSEYFYFDKIVRRKTVTFYQYSFLKGNVSLFGKSDVVVIMVSVWRSQRCRHFRVTFAELFALVRSGVGSLPIRSIHLRAQVLKEINSKFSKD